MPYIGNKTADTTLVEDNSITSAKIVNDAVTKDKTDLITDSGGASLEAKGSSGYDGAIRLNCSVNSHFTELKSASHGSYSGNLNFTLPSSTGTNGQFLQTNGSGVLSFADAGGTHVEVAEANITSNVGSHFFSNVFSTTYDSYFLQIRAMRFAGDSTPQLRFLTDTGTTENNSAYHYWSYYGLDNSGDEKRGNGNGDTKLVLSTGTDADSTSDGGLSGHIYFFNPRANDSRSVVVTSQFVTRDNVNNRMCAITGGGTLSNTSPRYGFVIFGGQNIALLRATLYGIVK